MAVILHFVRHAMAVCNETHDYTIPDPPLTEYGREQATKLNRLTEHIQQTAELIVTSPLTRAVQTAIIGFQTLRARLEAQPKKIIALSYLQEMGLYPCNKWLPREELEKIEEFSGIDFSLLEDDWTSQKGDDDLEQRCYHRVKWVRNWLRARPEKEIVVVAHAGILEEITGTRNANDWEVCEVRQYTFISEDDEEADVIPMKVEASVGLTR